MTLLLSALFLLLSSASPPPGEIDKLMAEPSVQRAIADIRKNEPQTIDEQVRLCEIPAPPFKESLRAEAYRKAFQSNGLKNVRIDAAGNVIGERPGLTAHPNVVVSAHLDTVFPEGTDLRVTRQGTSLKGPGIGDDCRGLAVLLGVLRAMNAAQLQTAGTVTFVGTVGEEGLGDLRGVKHLFDVELKGRVDRFVSVDGAGDAITHRSVGSRRYKVTVRGPGGHSYSAFGLVNPVHALGRAIARIAEFAVPQDPKTTFNVGRIGGGTSVNSIAFEAWMEIDMRSADDTRLRTLDAQLHAALDAALADEHARWSNGGKLTMDRQLVGDRPAGTVSESAPIVQSAVGATRALNMPVSLVEGSTDANYPMSLGVPAVTIDGGGSGEHAHSLEERFDTTNSWQGTARALLLTLLLAK